MCTEVWSNTPTGLSRRPSSTNSTRATTSSTRLKAFGSLTPKANREDDLLDTFCYGIALALGNIEGF
jgi:hypothetical protein